jgi:Ca2+-binding RTX toxin-like protein
MALTQTQVSQLYVSIIGRASEGEGNTFWQGASDMDTAAGSMLDSAAAQAYFGSTLDSNQAFIEHIYQNTLGKTVAEDPDGIAFWVNALDGGMSKGDIIVSLIDAAMSPDVTDKDAQNLFINQVEVSDYCADTIPTSDPTDLSDFTGYITSVTADSTSVDTVKATIDADAPVIVDGDTFTLTTGDDVFGGTADSDLFVAAAGTLSDDDVVLDSSLADNDIMNIVYEASDVTLVADITNVENINVEMDMLNGAAFDATNVTGATITVSSQKFGFDGAVTVSNAEDNGVTAGANVTDLIVTGLEDGIVTAGSAETVGTTSAAGDDVNLSVSGDVAVTLTSTAADLGTLSIEATADAEVDLTLDTATGIGELLGSGSGALTVVGDAAVFNALEISGVDTLTFDANTAAAPIDMVDVDVATVGLATATATELDADLTGAALVAGSTVNVDASVTAGELTLTNYESATVNYSAAVAAAILNTDSNVDVNVAAAAMTNLDVFGATGSVVTVTGTSDIALDVNTTGTVDASGVTGNLTVTTTAATAAALEIVGGTGDNSFTLSTTTGSADITTGNGETTVTTADLTGTLAVTGGTGADTIDAILAATGGGTIAAQLGAGDDTVKLVTAGAATTYAFQFGTGTDTLNLADTTNLTADDITISGLENITISEDGSDASHATLSADMLNGQSYTITSDDADEDATAAVTLNIDVAATDTAIDFSGLTIAGDAKAATIDATVIDANLNTAATSIVGTSVKDTITGSSAAANTIDGGAGNDIIVGGDVVDTITGGAGNDSITGGLKGDILTGGAGSDTFVFTTLNSTANTTTVLTNMDKISDFNIAQFDKLDLVNANTVIADDVTVAVDVSAADADGLAADINATVANGIVTLAGDDIASIDTVAEWIDVVETAGVLLDTAAQTGIIAFELDGNTYVYEATTSTMDNIIELTGVAGIDAVSATAGVDTLVIA